MQLLYCVILLLGAVCFVASAFNVTHPRVSLVPLGLFLWILVPLIQILSRLD